MKCGELKSMWDYQEKQEKKIAILETLEKITSDRTGACDVQEVTDRTGCAEWAESVEMTRIEAGHIEAAGPDHEMLGSL